MLRFPALTSLDLSKGLGHSSDHGHSSDDTLDFLREMKSLTSLRLCRLPLNANDLGSIAANCLRLKHLDLRGCDSIKFKMLGCLKSLPSLKTLNCSGAKQSSTTTLSELDGDSDLCNVRSALILLCILPIWFDSPSRISYQQFVCR